VTTKCLAKRLTLVAGVVLPASAAKNSINIKDLAMTMAAEPSDAMKDEERLLRREKAFASINRAEKFLGPVALGWVAPILRIAYGDSVKRNLKEIWHLAGIPLAAIALFLLAWSWTAPKVQTSLGAIPGPAAVWTEAGNLYDDHQRSREKADAFYERQETRNEKLVAEGKEDRVKWRVFTGAPTYLDQIWTSLQTVFFGFLIASLIAIPIGIACGLSKTVNAGFNPLIQIFKCHDGCFRNGGDR